MKKSCFIAGLLVAIGFTGCRSTSSLRLDVWRPAKVTFPIEVSRVTVVNNALDPDERVGNRYTDIADKEYSLVIPHDSTTYRLGEAIAVELADARYFPEVTVFYDDSIKLPKAPYPLLTEAQLDTIRGGFDSTAVVSLDRADMTVKMTDGYVTSEIGETLCTTDLEVATMLGLRIYLPNRLDPITEMVTDTVFWQGWGYTPDEAKAALPSREAFVQEATWRAASQVRYRLIPYIDQVRRYIYTSTNPAMSDAYDFWQEEKYTEASYLWEYIYEEQKSTSAAARAMAAANLALYNELNDDYAQAIEWIDKALAQFKERPENYADDIALLQDYRRQLVERQNDNSILQKQL